MSFNLPLNAASYSIISFTFIKCLRYYLLFKAWTTPCSTLYIVMVHLPSIFQLDGPQSMFWICIGCYRLFNIIHRISSILTFWPDITMEEQELRLCLKVCLVLNALYLLSFVNLHSSDFLRNMFGSSQPLTVKLFFH